MISRLGFTCPVCKLLWSGEVMYRDHLRDHQNALELAYIELAEHAVGRDMTMQKEADDV